MTERESGAGSGGTEDNVRDEFDEATERRRSGKDASKEAAKEETGGGAAGGVKDNVRDDWEESQQR